MLLNLFCIELLVLASHLPSSDKLKDFFKIVNLLFFHYFTVKSRILKVFKTMLSNLFCIELLILYNHVPKSDKLKKCKIGKIFFLNSVKNESLLDLQKQATQIQ